MIPWARTGPATGYPLPPHPEDPRPVLAWLIILGRAKNQNGPLRDGKQSKVEKNIWPKILFEVSANANYAQFKRIN